MNDLIISIAKERILPLRFDSPSTQIETQMYRIAVYMTRTILDAFLTFSNWSSCDAPKFRAPRVDEATRLSLALKTVFPREWLSVAETSPHFHLRLQKVFRRYELELEETSIARIHQVVEFLCFELIETAIIESRFARMADLTPEHLLMALDADPMLKKIITSQSIYIVRAPQISPGLITLEGLNVSHRGLRLLRLYVEELIRATYDRREDREVLTLADIDAFFV
jgi:hypothetical protein